MLFFFQKSLFTENYFLIAAINLATRGPLYTCLVLHEVRSPFSFFLVTKSEQHTSRGIFEFFAIYAELHITISNFFVLE